MKNKKKYILFPLFLALCLILITAGTVGSLTVEYKKKCSQALWCLLFLCQIFCFII